MITFTVFLSPFLSFDVCAELTYKRGQAGIMKTSVTIVFDSSESDFGQGKQSTWNGELRSDNRNETGVLFRLLFTTAVSPLFPPFLLRSLSTSLFNNHHSSHNTDINFPLDRFSRYL